MTGEGGDDVYVYNSISDSKIGDDCDVIWGFGNGNDKIDLSKVDANALVDRHPGVQVDRRQPPSPARPASCAPSSTGRNTIIQGDVNGDKVVDFHIQVMGSISFSSADFVL